MGKPWALRLLRSCFLPSGSKRNEETTMVEVNLDEGNNNSDACIVSVSLPEDIIFDVLARLPVKTLCRFRCVSKGWRALLSDPAFAAAQRSCAAATPLVVGVFGVPRPLDKFYPFEAPWFPEKSLELRVLDTADGNVLRVVKDVKSAKLMHTRLDLVFVDQGVHGASVTDPATGRALTLGGEAVDAYPRADYNGSSYIMKHFQLYHSSFGRATPSGTYKVVRLRDVVTADGSNQICQIATLEDDIAAKPTWRQRPEPPILTCRCSGCTATVDGVLYFMDRGAPIHGRRRGPPGWNRIASFDLENEEWKTMINGPSIGYPNKGERWDMALAVLNGNLSVVQMVWSRNRPGVRDTNIWLLVHSQQSAWVKEYTIQMPRSWYLFRALDILDDRRILMLTAFQKEGDSMRDVRCILQLYDPSTGASIDLVEMGKDFRGPMTLYTGSLLS